MELVTVQIQADSEKTAALVRERGRRSLAARCDVLHFAQILRRLLRRAGWGVGSPHLLSPRRPPRV